MIDVLIDLRAADKASLLAALARHAAAHTGLDATGLRQLLLAREALGSTGVGNGIALPHARAAMAGMYRCFARLDRPVGFDAIDGAPVDLVFLQISPVDDPASHLAGLAAASRRLRDRVVAQAIRGATEAAQIAALLGWGQGNRTSESRQEPVEVSVVPSGSL